MRLFIYFFAIIGLILSVLLAVVFFRPATLEHIGMHEVSSDLYSCMTYKDPAILQRIYRGEINLKEARAIADARDDIADEYTACLQKIFGYHTVWVNERHSIIYD